MILSKNIYPIFKRTFDIVFSIFIIPWVIPLMILILLLIIITMGFPPFFLQKRIGIYEKEFTIIKFRTMKKGEELGRGYLEKARITRVGKILRIYHFDELPQIFLILIGKMSFVGPRPLLKEHLFGYDTISIRCSVKPGLMCYAQNKLYKNRYLDKNEQIDLDIKYVDEASIFVDIKIIAETIILHLKRSFIQNIV